MDAKRPGIIRRFFSGLMKLITALRLILVNVLFLVLILVIVVIISSSELPKVPEKGALVLDIKGTLVDQKRFTDPFVSLMGDADPRQQETLLQDVIDAIEHAKNDQRITLLVLSLDQMVYGGISKMQEIAAALQDFRSSGKKIIAVGDYYTQDQYWLAAQADEVHLNPMGGVLLQGYGLYRNYYKQALDKLHVNFHIFKVGAYKSAMEPFMRNDMSPQAREANLLWLTSLWNDYTTAVAKRRSLASEDINRYINTLDQLMQQHSGDTAAVALAAGLVDSVKNRNEIGDYLLKQVGVADKDGVYQRIGFERYLWLKNVELPEFNGDKAVGVIVAAGNIVDGEQPPGTIGGDTLAQLIKTARTNKKIRALVLRVDSGGGSAFASEVIRKELQLLKRTGKPLVVSMGSVAASGGYWISAAADQIWATSATLTGSIGIFGAFPTIEKSLSHIGVNNDGVGTTEMAGSLRVNRPLKPMAARVIQSSIEHGYDQFLTVVAEGRSLDKADVAEMAQGRVWSGLDAKRLGLVDSIGGLNEAIKAAAMLANVKQYETELIEIPLSPQQQLIRELTGKVAAIKGVPVLNQIQALLAPFTHSLDFVKQMNDPKGEYLFCTMCVAP